MLKNEEGADFLPMRLVAVLVAASIILSLAVSCLTMAIGQVSRAAARSCAAQIAAIAAAEYVDGYPDTGSGITLEVNVPESVRAITFEPSLYDGADGRGEGGYLLQFTDGTAELHVAGAPVGAGANSSARGGWVILYPGHYAIHVHLETVDRRPMVLLYPEEL